MNFRVSWVYFFDLIICKRALCFALRDCTEIQFDHLHRTEIGFWKINSVRSEIHSCKRALITKTKHVKDNLFELWGSGLHRKWSFFDQNVPLRITLFQQICLSKGHLYSKIQSFLTHTFKAWSTQKSWNPNSYFSRDSFSVLRMNFFLHLNFQKIKYLNFFSAYYLGYG